MDKLSYALGLSIGNNIKGSGIDSIDAATFTKGLQDIMTGNTPAMTNEEAQEVINTFFAEAQGEKTSINAQAGADFLASNKSKPGVVTLESGLQYQILTAGTGAIPTATDQVKCHYHGTLIDGTVFDSSVERGKPATFGVNQVIKGWVEALQLMETGSKWKLFIPSNLAYGEAGAGQSIEPNTALIFEVEILEII